LSKPQPFGDNAILRQKSRRLQKGYGVTVVYIRHNCLMPPPNALLCSAEGQNTFVEIFFALPMSPEEPSM
jgi:hypothetical protein